MSVLVMIIGAVVFELVFAIGVGKFLKAVSPPEPVALPAGMSPSYRRMEP